MTRDAGLGPIFVKNLPDFHWQSVETGGVGRGVPDYNYCSDGCEGWVEFKRVNGWQCVIRPEQVAWAERRHRAGGRVFLACRKGRDLLWLFGANDFRTVMLDGVQAARALILADYGPSKWPWAAIRDVLKNN